MIYHDLFVVLHWPNRRTYMIYINIDSSSLKLTELTYTRFFFYVKIKLRAILSFKANEITRNFIEFFQLFFTYFLS